MPFAPAPPLQLRRGDREILEAMVRKRTLAQRLAFRARIILSCADGLPHRQIKRRLNTSVDTVIRWRKRYEWRKAPKRGPGEACFGGVKGL
jgi:diphthamide synthase (EF-2-diphthine--ammonia ligase)